MSERGPESADQPAVQETDWAKYIIHRSRGFRQSAVTAQRTVCPLTVRSAQHRTDATGKHQIDYKIDCFNRSTIEKICPLALITYQGHPSLSNPAAFTSVIRSSSPYTLLFLSPSPLVSSPYAASLAESGPDAVRSPVVGYAG